MHTRDSLFGGRLSIRQQEKGYRFSVDAVLLAGLTRVKPRDRGIDLGTGCGVVPLVFAYRGEGREWTGLEIQTELAELAKTNAAENGLGDRVSILEGDLREYRGLFQPQSFDLVVSNPPYRGPWTGRVAPGRQRALARHEFTAAVGDVAEAAAYLLPPGGRLAVVYPSVRLPSLIKAVLENGFQPKRLTVIHSREGERARLVHLESVRGGGEELLVEPPFYIYAPDGSYTPETQKLYRISLERGGDTRRNS
jgi:tRNA1Val (adenine37-N6)-methyltransferase